ncbi:hypothetical protein [Caldicellulosiruptor morganii]|jgi:hypothetical protein|uniref:Thiazolylpeptide-type bacteriocin n=1 Tax=Caldicellulosiruptor morganii TaxID=1387555 RepID=A0ABY7BRA3_9FIRM|nr:hypothetical protein [Caldicellulosiruptor morganii]WAM34897.1 hypothetical protein OTK00_001158 [Caldicellulosiruptor morganii]
MIEKNFLEELKEVLETQDLDLSEIETLEEIVTPASGCGCGGLCR